MQLDQPVPGQLPQPRVERQRPATQVVRQFLSGIGQDFLDNVRRIDASGETAIHADRDHPAQPVAVPDQELLASGTVAAAGAFDEQIGIRLADRWHRGVYPLTLTPQNHEKGDSRGREKGVGSRFRVGFVRLR